MTEQTARRLDLAALWIFVLGGGMGVFGLGWWAGQGWEWEPTLYYLFGPAVLDVGLALGIKGLVDKRWGSCGRPRPGTTRRAVVSPGKSLRNGGRRDRRVTPPGMGWLRRVTVQAGSQGILKRGAGETERMRKGVKLDGLPVIAVTPGSGGWRCGWSGRVWREPGTKRRTKEWQLTACYVSLRAAAAENDLAPQTLSHWINQRRLPVVAVSEQLTGARGLIVEVGAVRELLEERGR